MRIDVRTQVLVGRNLHHELVVNEVADGVAGPPEKPHREARPIARQPLKHRVVPGIRRMTPQSSAEAEYRGLSDVVADRLEECITPLTLADQRLRLLREPVRLAVSSNIVQKNAS